MIARLRHRRFSVETLECRRPWIAKGLGDQWKAILQEVGMAAGLEDISTEAEGEGQS